MKKLLLLLHIFIGLSPSLHAQVNMLEIKMHKGAYYDVFANTVEGETINITKFEPWVELRDLKVSPDSTYFFYRYKKEGEAYRLVVHKLVTLEKVAEIVPGYGGLFEWNQSNFIVHRWGCGSNCSNLRVYNHELVEEFFSLSGGGFIFLDQYNYVIQFSYYHDQFWLMELFDFQSKKVHCYESEVLNKDMEYAYDSFKLSAKERKLSYSLSQRISTEISLDSIPFRWVNPKEFGEFYERDMD